MIRRLRWKFVLINLSLILIVFIALLCVIYGTTYTNLQVKVEKSMEQILESGKLNPTKLQIGKDKEHDIFPEEKPLDTSGLTTFLVRQKPEGGLITEGKNLVISDPTAIEALVALIQEKEEAKGQVSYNGTWYDYIIRTGERGGALIVLHDRSDEIYQMRELFWKLVGVGLGGLIAFGVISIVLAGWAVKPIESSLEQQRRFVADASHELKTPLSVILANVGVVLSHPERTIEEESRWLSYIQEEGARMSELVGNLLYLAKSDDGSLQKVLQKVNISDIIWGELLHFESLAFEAGRKLKSEVEPDLYVHGDDGQLKRLVDNLLENAVKYSEEKSVIHLSLEKQRDKAVLTVHNTGPALSEEQIKHVFERFYRADQARGQEIGGYGLGLSIVQAIVEAHKGKISVHSNKEEGTSFIVVLPLEKMTEEK